MMPPMGWLVLTLVLPSPPGAVAGGAAGSDQGLAGVDCGVRRTPAEWARHRRLHDAGAYRLTAGQAGPFETVVVPIAFHFVRRSDGSGGPVDAANLAAKVLFDVNAHLAPMGMHFCRAGAIDFIDDDVLYEAGTDSTLPLIHVVPNAVNVWISPSLAVCGSSSTASGLQGITGPPSCLSLTGDNNLMAHELGHYFDLEHTHATIGGPECVDGSNCSLAGDLLCDTPADPDLTGRVGPAPGCAYTGADLDACGSGQPYDPDTGNIMSYAPNPCRNHFTPQQIELARATLINLRPEFFADNDCNSNGMPDACDLLPAVVSYQSPDLAPLTSLTPVDPAYTLYQPPLAAQDVTLSFTARGDLGSAAEAVVVDINGATVGAVFAAGGQDCPQQPDAAQLIIPAATFNSAVARSPDQHAVITMSATPGVGRGCVDGQGFDQSFIRVAISYAPQGGPGDANGNGVLDVCDPDCNANGVLDPDEVHDGLSPDCNANGSPDACDLSGGGAILLAADFEGGLPPGWEVEGVFQVTDQCGDSLFAPNDTFFAYAGDPASCHFGQGQTGRLTAPPVALPAGASVLRFRERFGSGNSGDQAQVTANGVVMDLQFFGSDTAWRERQIDLSALVGQAVTVEFLFKSTSPAEDLGWQIDDIRIVAGSADCNHNRLPDDCEAVIDFHEVSGPLTPFGTGFPQQFIVKGAPRAAGDVELELSAVADLAAPSQFVRLRLNNALIANLFDNEPAGQCPAVPDIARITLTAAEYNTRLAQGGGDAAFSLLPLGNINPNLCSPSFVQLGVRYPAGSPLDTDADGVLDDCPESAVPAARAGGLALMALLLIILAVVVLRRRGRPGGHCGGCRRRGESLGLHAGDG